MKYLALVMAAGWASAACKPSSKSPRADSAAAPADSALMAAPTAAPTAAAPAQPPIPDSILTLGADGPGLRRAAVDALKLPVPRTLDLSHVAPAHVAAALGRDPSRIFTYVRDEVAFEAYKGALRGSRGTLLAMAGNSVDRAALLAAMLASSGQRVRFVRGTLPEPDAERLVASMWAPRASPAAQTDDGASPDARAATEQFMAAVQRDGRLVVDLLQRAGRPVQSGLPVSLQSLAQEARDHYWVESSPDGRSWTALDPSFATAAPGQVFAQPAERLTILPDGIFHHIELRVRIEEAVAGGLATREVLKYSARAADLSGTDVFLGHVAGTGAEANRLRPVLLVGPTKIEGEWFWLQPPAAGNASVSMVDALGGSAEEAAGTVTAETIELDFANPDGSGETVVRDVFDHVGKHRRKAGVALSDAQITAAASSLPVAEFTTNVYDLFFTTGAVAPVHLMHLVDRPDGSPDRFDIGAGLHRVALGYTAVSDALTNRIVGRSGAVTRLYPDTPRLTIVALTTVNGRPHLGLDLRRERARAVNPGFRKEQLFLAQVLRGVVDGTLERVVVGAAAGGANADPHDAVFGTSLLFELASAQKVSPVLVTRGGPALGDDLPEDGRARLEESLDAGQLVIAPARAIQVAGAKRYAWWEIDPRYGATMAVTDEGLHQATVEANILRDKDAGTVNVSFRTGNGLRSREQFHHFYSEAEANNFITGMMRRFEQAGVEVIWGGAGI
ncbi:MAG: hypothetical protein ACREOQ_00740 [Gemmatimonadales bacterium]